MVSSKSNAFMFGDDLVELGQIGVGDLVRVAARERSG
jgi:hypothetical protein